MVRMVDFTTINEAVEFDRSEAGRVVAVLSSYDSREYTLLAKDIQIIATKEAELAALKASVKERTKEHVASLFDAADAVNTRIVDTISFTLTLSKNPKATETYQYSKVISAIRTELTSDQIKVLDSLLEQFKTVTQKLPSLKVEPKNNESIGEGFGDVVDYFSNYAKKVFNFLKRYDAKFARIKQMAAQV